MGDIAGHRPTLCARAACCSTTPVDKTSRATTRLQVARPLTSCTHHRAVALRPRSGPERSPFASPLLAEKAAVCTENMTVGTVSGRGLPCLPFVVVRDTGRFQDSDLLGRQGLPSGGRTATSARARPWSSS